VPGEVTRPATDDDLAELVEETGLTLAEWKDLLSNAPTDQAFLLASWKTLGKMTWVADPGALAKVLAVLGALAAPVVEAGSVAGAASAIVALKNL
jgi:hypothetical protein